MSSITIDHHMVCSGIEVRFEHDGRIMARKLPGYAEGGVAGDYWPVQIRVTSNKFREVANINRHVCRADEPSTGS